MEGILFAYGNPLLDISADVDAKFLEKYDLDANNAILAEDKHKTMYDDMTASFDKVEYVPGGATQNTIRVAQWLIGIPEATTFIGCIGKDKYGKILEDKTKEAGVCVRYQYHDKEPTGTCAVLLTDQGKNRSLCAYLAAANEFTKDHLEKPEVNALMEKAQFYYCAGFPLTVSPPSMLHIARYASSQDRLFMMNLSAPFLCQFFKDPMMEIMPYVDVLFGNESEAEAFSETHNYGTKDLKEIALKLARFPKENGSRARMVVLTHGALPTIIVQNGEVKEFPVIPIKPEDIVDTNGAGDAYVGGFLAEFVQGRSLEESVRCGNYAANFIIQKSGCSLPIASSYNEHSACF
jgi:adenosine kinase